ncbi:Hypothetical predicted protein [Octopus vulgaris]|uniref:Reverse transcriptase domain-containing protein n=1 Tax=Octopus vulgaris TaxID=6645 RepID=A0AA36ASK5_OCTVU|nr:Hypothetical predicted protein [Octopus vulgaris]
MYVCMFALPQDLHDAVIITLYKNKGEKSDCSNYRGNTLLSIAGKVLAKILLNRLVPTIAEENLPVSQCGFRDNRYGVRPSPTPGVPRTKQGTLCYFCRPHKSI